MTTKKIAIIGAGPAGIEAAQVLASKGYAVEMFEKEASALSHVADKAYLFPNFAEANQIVETMLQTLDNKNIEVRYGTEIVDAKRSEGQWILKDSQNHSYQYDRVIIATGYKPFDAHRKEELGYGIYNGVVTSLEMEKMIREGSIVGAMGERPRRITFLQCVGSRDEKSGNHYCSKVCCVTGVKQAIEAKRQLENCEIYLFYMDLRMWGQGFEEMYRRAQQEYGVRFVRGRISEAAGTFDNRIQIKAEDTLMGLPMRLTTDLLVLMVGMEASEGTCKLAQACGIAGDYGFAKSEDPHLKDCRTSQEHLYVGGACKRPMSLTDAVNDGRSAALEVMNSL